MGTHRETLRSVVMRPAGGKLVRPLASRPITISPGLARAHIAGKTAVMLAVIGLGRQHVDAVAAGPRLPNGSNVLSAARSYGLDNARFHPPEGGAEDGSSMVRKLSLTFPAMACKCGSLTVRMLPPLPLRRSSFWLILLSFMLESIPCGMTRAGCNAGLALDEIVESGNAGAGCLDCARYALAPSRLERAKALLMSRLSIRSGTGLRRPQKSPRGLDWP